MQNPLVSIIVPIYNVEPYLRRCLDSIVNQSYTNLEIILVDDGSPDGCPKICDEYANKDNRIVVIHKENGGLSSARNSGLDICKGEYISFIDSDDWVSPKYIDILLKNLLDNKADLAIANYTKTSKPYILEAPEKKRIIPEILQPIQAVKKLWSTDAIAFGTAWAKLAKISLYQNIRFPEGLIHEDDYTSYKLLYTSSRTVFLRISLYYYFQRNDSIMGSIKSSSIRALKAHVERYQFFKKKQEKELSALCLKPLCWDLLFAYAQRGPYDKSVGYTNKKEILLLLRKCLQDFNSTNHSFFERKILSFFSKFPFFYALYQNLFPLKIRKK